MALPPWVLALFNIGTTEIIFLLILLVLLFGANKIPELARAFGRAQKEFSKAKEEIEKEETAATPEEERIKRAAKDLGLSVEGKSITEIKAEMARKLSTEANFPPNPPPMI